MVTPKQGVFLLVLLVNNILINKKIILKNDRDHVLRSPGLCFEVLETPVSNHQTKCFNSVSTNKSLSLLKYSM